MRQKWDDRKFLYLSIAITITWVLLIWSGALALPVIPEPPKPPCIGLCPGK